MTSQLLAFVGVCVLITLVPGLDTALITRNVVARGRRAGLVTALGTSSGLCVHAVAVALGPPHRVHRGSMSEGQWELYQGQ